MGENGDEALTPAGRLFLQEETKQVIHCVVGLKNPIDVESVKSEVRKSTMLQHPRFTSLLVRDQRGEEHWRPTQVEIDRHLRVIEEALGEEGDERAINGYLAELSIDCDGLSMDKPLWEIHLLMAHKCLIFRIHHALGDGISLMSLFLASCRKLNDPQALPTIASSASTPSNASNPPFNFWNLLLTLFFSFLFILDFILRCLWVRDPKSSITGGAGVQLWPRKIATASFSLQDMKTVKTAVNATINDVLFAVISCGVSRYLDFRAPNGLRDGVRLTGLAMVNLRKQPGLQELSNLMKNNSGARWGNKFGMILLPIYYHRSNFSDPLEYLKRAKATIDRKKRTLEASFSYKIGDFVMSTLGPKFAGLLNYRILCHTTFTISNVVGPQEEIMIGGNPITFLRANNSALPHALVLNMVSYAGRADMQVQVAKAEPHKPQGILQCQCCLWCERRTWRSCDSHGELQGEACDPKWRARALPLMATTFTFFQPTIIRASAGSPGKPDPSNRKPVSSNWWAPLFGWPAEADYIGPKASGKPDPERELGRAGSKFGAGCFTEEKAKQLRKKTVETSTFHDIMYHSAIASRLASDVSKGYDK